MSPGENSSGYSATPAPFLPVPRRPAEKSLPGHEKVVILRTDKLIPRGLQLRSSFQSGTPHARQARADKVHFQREASAKRDSFSTAGDMAAQNAGWPLE